MARLEAQEYRLDGAKTITISCPSTNTTIGHRVTNFNGLAPYFVFGTAGTVNGTTRTGTITVGVGSGATQFYIETGYLTSGSPSVFTPSGEWYQSILFGSGAVGLDGNFNSAGQPQDEDTGIEANPNAAMAPYELQGYTLGNTGGGGGVGGAGTYTNTSGQDEIIHYTLKDAAGNITAQWDEFLPPNGTSTPNIQNDEAGGTLEYFTTGQMLLDGAIRDVESTETIININNPITAQTQSTPVTTQVINTNVNTSPKAVTTETRTVVGSAAPTNAADDQRNRELRGEIQRLALIADSASKQAHTDAEAIKTAVEAIEGGGGGTTTVEVDMTETNAKLDSIDSKLAGTIGDTTLEDTPDGAGFSGSIAALNGKLALIGDDITTIANALVFPTVGTSTLNFTVDLPAKFGGTFIYNLDAYLGIIGTFRAIVLAVISVFFVFEILHTVKGAFS